MVGSAWHARWVRITAALLLMVTFCASLSVFAPTPALASHARALTPLDATVTPTSATPPSTQTVMPITPSIGSDGPPPAPPTTTAAASELYDATTGKLLMAISPDTSLPMASTTKIMTAVVALTYGRLDQQITVGQDAVAVEDGSTSVAGLRLGETLSLRELLYCLMLPSGDDAAIAIADGVAGSQDAFVALMNVEAGLLGLSHTHYANAHGLDAPEHFTSVSDLVRLAAFAMKSSTFAQVVDTASITLSATATHQQYIMTNTNELLPTETFAYNGAIGVKTGFTGPAGYCLVFMAKRPIGGTLIGAVLGEPTYNGRFTDATALLDWGYSVVTPAAKPASTGAKATATATP